MALSGLTRVSKIRLSNSCLTSSLQVRPLRCRTLATNAGFHPSLANMPKNKETGVIERPVWPMTNRNSFFASLGSEDEAVARKDKNKLKGKPLHSAKEAMQSLLADLKDLKSENPGMKIEINGQDEVVLRLTNKPDVSFFRVKLVSGKDDELAFEAPSSAGMLRTYKRNEFGEWNCPQDGHNLHGLLLRDLLPHIYGMPRFASK